MHRAAVILAALVIVLLVGCGGGGASYSLDSTASCLEGKGATVSTDDDDLDYVAQDAGEGALDAEVRGNEVTIVFERSGGDAERTEAAYKVFAGAFDTSVEDILERRGNVVIVWDKTPDEGESGVVDECLQG